jgi:predicted dehydrogenase
MTAKEIVHFGVIGANHNHIYSQVDTLLQAGALFDSFYIQEDELADSFAAVFPFASRVERPEAILEDRQIRMVASAAIPCERAEIGLAVMRAGKDFFSDKPGFTTLEQVERARQVQAQTGRIYSIYFSERLGNPASVKAGELVKAGAIGQVIQTIGLGPHRLNLSSRPDWFFQKAKYGGILVDIAAHQVDQFLFYTGAKQAQVVSALVANYHHPEYRELEDFGEMLVRAETATGYMRVDWFTPDGLPVWGDGRLMILGTEGSIEVRKYIDLAGREGDCHLFLTSRSGVEYMDCKDIACPFGIQLLEDTANRTETAMPQEHVFRASELALQAEAMALRLGHLHEGE